MTVRSALAAALAAVIGYASGAERPAPTGSTARRDSVGITIVENASGAAVDTSWTLDSAFAVRIGRDHMAGTIRNTDGVEIAVVRRIVK